MPSTYSPSLKIELIGNGEQTGTWGQTTNNNLGTLIEQAIAGVGQITLVGDTTLTNFNGLPDESRNAVLVFSGSLAAPANVVAPSVEKTYIITNNSGANVTIKTSTGNGVTVLNGLNSLVYCDGTNFYTAVNVNNVIGDLSVSGNETLAGSLTIGGNITLANTVTAGNLAMTANSGIVTMAGNVGAFLPPTGTTAQRPATPVLGMSRWNTSLGAYEIWNGITWQIVAAGAYNIEYLIVAGGGGGGQNRGGGAGAGGLLTGILSANPGTVYSFVVGAGGVGSTNNTDNSTSGAFSSAFSLTALGGGRGGVATSGGSGSAANGTNGSAIPGGAGTAGQGNAGGFNAPDTGEDTGAGGGGGGAGAIGGNGSGSSGGNGGIGRVISFTGSAIYYAGGGAGGNGAGGSPGTGGLGGGGSGVLNSNGGAGTNGLGGGGAGGSYFVRNGGNGGSGVVILSVATVSYTGVTTGGPTVTTSGANTILTYTSSGSYTA
jgi:hypothetical protein